MFPTDWRAVVRRFIALTLIAFLAACSGGGGIVPRDGSTADSASHRGKGHLVLRVHIPKRKHRLGRGARYVSPSTKGMTIAFTGPATVSKTLGLTPSSPGCSASPSGTTCTVTLSFASCATKANCYTGSIATYDDVSCTASCAITSGPDGNLWFTEDQTSRIGKITTNGTITEYSSGITAGAVPLYITTGSDRNLWFTELSGNRIGRMQ
jgi:hypothetical protein